jgi:hypothetical protein
MKHILTGFVFIVLSASVSLGQSSAFANNLLNG